MDRYRIIDEIGEGYYAKVYRAWDRQRGTEVAVKFAKPFEDAQMKIHHEYAILSRINHPNVLKVFDFDGWGKKPYFTSEFIPGKPITEYFSGRSRSELPNVMYQLLAGLASIHAQGYLHLDLKPDNILIVPKQNTVKILDLGFSEILSEKTTPVGTLGYLAPEILSRIPIDYRADLYSIGVLLYYIYVGRPPFDLKSPIATLRDQITGTFQEPIEINSKINPRINALIMKLLSPDPSSRPSTCHELLAEFEATFQRVKKRKRIAIPELTGITFAPGIVGREEEIRGFEALIPINGKTIYALKGEPGFGKTTLINHLGFKVKMAGIDNIRYLPASGRPSLIQLLSEYLSLEISGAETDDPLIVYEQIFRKLKEDLPFAVIIDEAEGLSPSDLALLRYIIFGFDDQDPFLLLIGGENGEWESIIEAVDAHLYELKPFDRHLIEETLGRIFGVIINIHWLSNFLYQKTGGRPSAIYDIINLAFRIGAMKYGRGGWEYDPVRLEALETTDSLIQPTIDSLPDPIRFAVEALMVSKTPVPITALYLALKGEAVDIPREFKRLWFIEEVATPTGSCFRIRGEGLRQELADALAKKKRTDTAGTLLKAMEKITSPDNEHTIFALADLAIEANLLRKMRVYCRKAADLALESFLSYRALGYYKSLKKIGEDGKVEALIGDCYWMLGDLERALSHYEAAPQSFSLQLKRSRVLRNLKRYHESIRLLESIKKKNQNLMIEKGSALIGIGSYQEAEAALRKASEVSRKKKDRRGVFRSVYYLAELFLRQERYDEAENKAGEAVRLARNLSPDDLASALILLASIVERQNKRDTFLEILNEAERVVDGHSLTRLKKHILEWQLKISHDEGDLTRSKQYAREFLNLMERIGEKSGIIRALIMDGLTSAYLLEVRSGESQLKRALRLARENPLLKANTLHNLGWLAYMTLDHGHAHGYLKEAVAIYQGLGEKELLTTTLSLLAMVKINMNDLAGAEEVLREVDDDNIRANFARVQLFLSRSDYESAQKMLDRIRRKKLDFYDKIDCDLLQAQVTARGVDIDEAVSKLHRLTEELSRAEHRFYYLHTLLSLIDLIITHNGYSHLDIFRDAINRIEFLIRDRSLEAVELKVKSLKDQAFHRLIGRGVHPRITKILRRLADAVNLYMGGAGIFEEILDVIIEATRAERGAIFIRGEGGLKLCAGRGIDRQTIVDAREFSSGIINRIQERPIITNDALTDEAFRNRRSVQLNKIRSLIAAPLVIDKKAIGAVYLDSRITAGLFTDEHLDLLIGITPLLSTLIEKSKFLQGLIWDQVHKDFDPGEVYLNTNSRIMAEIYEMVNRVADSDVTVFLSGETGVGKGVIARLIHEKSRRKGKFISVNCATLPDTLFESELFGYKKGAFTDARQDKLGLIESANNGTIFLDEVTSISPSAQAKLLQVLEEKRFRRLGDIALRDCNIRLISATNRDIEAEIDAGKFRQDLFYRISTFEIRIPTLRERPADILPLARFFLNKIAMVEGRRIEGFTDEAIEILTSYPWPGNIRELINIIKRAVILARGEMITPKELRVEFARSKSVSKGQLIKVLRDSRTMEDAVRSLGVSRRSIYRLMKKYNIDRKTIER